MPKKIDRLFEPSQPFGEVPIARHGALARIGHKEDDVGLAHCDLGLHLDLLDKGVVVAEEQAPGIDELEPAALVRALGVKPVSGDAGLVLDDSDPAAGDTVEKGGLSDVRTADDHDCRQALGHGVGHYGTSGGEIALRAQVSLAAPPP